jgi:hypothetical protein
MEFRSIHSFEAIQNPLRYGQKILCVGSCFAANMGMLLEKHFFDAHTNPNGIIFNPISLVQGLQIGLNPSLFEEEKYIFEYNNRYYSWLHHGSFQASSKKELLEAIDTQNKRIHEQLTQGNFLLITWGSAHVYTLQSNQEIVANCHKLPGHFFQKRLLSVAEIVGHYQSFLKRLNKRSEKNAHALNPQKLDKKKTDKVLSSHGDFLYSTFGSIFVLFGFLSL